MIKIVAVSDTHNNTFDLPQGDILVHAGDLTMRGSMPEIVKGLDWLSSHKDKFKHIVFVAGNHDFGFQEEPEVCKAICENRNIIYLQDQLIELEGLKIYGSPWQPRYFDWAFNSTDAELEEHWKKIPEGIDILLTHCPPFSILDFVPRSYTHIGCRHLQSRVLEIKPKVHIFGHCHESFGYKELNGIHFYNVSTLDGMYCNYRDPVEIEL